MPDWRQFGLGKVYAVVSSFWYMWLRLLFGICILFGIDSVFAQQKFLHPELVARFYEERAGQFLWLRHDSVSLDLRESLHSIWDISLQQGVCPSDYPSKQFILGSSLRSRKDTQRVEYAYTDYALDLLLMHLRGFTFPKKLSFDALSVDTRPSENQWAVDALLGVYDDASLAKLFAAQEPTIHAYQQLYSKYKRLQDADSLVQIKESMSLLRWLGHFRFDRFILIDRSSAILYLFDGDTIRMSMRVVLGKKKTPSPTFAAWAESVLLYPYWYVPASIFYDEMVRKIIRDRNWLSRNNMEVVDGAGKVIDASGIKWSAYRRGGFPYVLRQRTGCDNALGVFKIDVQTPFSVFLHDTNRRDVFGQNNRYLSHGCIRLEDPIGLGYALMGDRVEADRLRACLDDQLPKRVQLLKPLPIILIDRFMN